MKKLRIRKDKWLVQDQSRKEKLSPTNKDFKFQVPQIERNFSVSLTCPAPPPYLIQEKMAGFPPLEQFIIHRSPGQTPQIFKGAILGVIKCGRWYMPGQALTGL